MPQALLEKPATKDVHAHKQVTLGLIAVFVIYVVNSYFMQTRSVARPMMAADLNGMAWYSWSISIPGLAGAFVTLIFSKFSDMYGRRIMMLISLSIYLLGTVLSAVSPTYWLLIAATTLTRFGSGAIAPLLLAVLGDMFPPVERSRWVGLLHIPSGFFALIGPSLSGWFVDNLSWRYIFWSGVPLLVVCQQEPQNRCSRLSVCDDCLFGGHPWFFLCRNDVSLGFRAGYRVDHRRDYIFCAFLPS
jgi:MFS family permease